MILLIIKVVICALAALYVWQTGVPAIRAVATKALAKGRAAYARIRGAF